MSDCPDPWHEHEESVCPRCGADARTLDVDRLVDAICAAEEATGWSLNVGEGPLADAIAAAWERLP